MTKLSKHIKWIAAISVVPVLLISVGIVNGGVRWSGMDPELLVNGDRINIWVEWPENYTCSIKGEIELEIGASKDAEIELIKESMETYGCDDGNTKLHVSTVSDITGKAKNNRIKIRDRMGGQEKFPFRLIVRRNGEFLAVCDGETHDDKYKADCRELHLEDGWSIYNGEENVKIGQDFLFGYEVEIKSNTVIGNNVELGDHVYLNKEIRIGNDVVINEKARIDERVTIGNGTFISDDSEIKKEASVGENVRTGRQASINDKAVIGNGTSIGDAVVIGNEVTIGANVEIGHQVTINDKVIICDGESIPDGMEIPKETTLGSC